MEGARYVDVWFEGEKFEVPKGDALGWGLRFFFGVSKDEDLYVLDSTSKVKTLVDSKKYYHVTHWDRFYKIMRDTAMNFIDGPHVVHIKSGEKYDQYVGRPTKWGNPFRMRHESERLMVVNKYRQWIKTQPQLIADAKRELRGKVLSCWCAPKPCHADVLVDIANGID